VQPLLIGQRLIDAARTLANVAPKPVLICRKLCNALPCVMSGLSSRAIAVHGWRARLDVSLNIPHFHRKHKSGKRGSELAIYLALPLMLGHSYSLVAEYMVVDCLVLLFVGGLLFPLVSPPALAESRHTYGPLSFRLVKA